jgi:hypothetical protein
MTQRVPTEERSPALKSYYANLEANRAKAREKAKARYHADKQAKLLKNAEYRRNNPEKLKLIKEVSNKKYYKNNKRRFFYLRALSAAMRVRANDNVESICRALSRAWYNQRGRCAYTGKRLDRKAQVDHKTPVTRGGDNDSQNLHWVTADVNNAKGSMTHDEFLAVCLCVSGNHAQ